MGTSSPGKGPRGDTPFIPPWATQNGPPPPEPPPRRFQQFRTQLGSFLKTGDRSSATEALRSYSRVASGGGSVASNRLGSSLSAGAVLYGLLSGSSDESVAQGTGYLKLTELSGKSCDEAIELIITGISEKIGDGDADKIRESLNYALSEALEGVDEFEASAISEDIINQIIIFYISETIYQKIITDAGDKVWDKAGNNSQIVNARAEEELRELISVTVELKFEEHIGNKSVDDLSEFFHLEEDIVKSVIDDWGQ